MRRFLVLVCLLAILILPGCRAAVVPAPQKGAAPRVVSLAPSITDILSALGAGPQIVGTCAVPGRPSLPGDIPVVASLGTVDLERVLGLKPTFCATVRGMQDPQALSDLGRFGLVVVQYPVDSLDQLWACMEDLGTRVGRAQAGRALATSCRERLEAVRRSCAGPRPRALILVGDEPAVVAGEGTFLDEVLRSAGFENAASPLRGYPQVDLERLVEWKPDLLVFPQGDISAAGAGFIADSLWRIIGRRPVLVGVPADILVRPGPQTAEAAERLAAERRRLGYPEPPAGSGGRRDNLPGGRR